MSFQHDIEIDLNIFQYETLSGIIILPSLKLKDRFSLTERFVSS